MALFPKNQECSFGTHGSKTQFVSPDLVKGGPSFERSYDRTCSFEASLVRGQRVPLFASICSNCVCFDILLLKIVIVTTTCFHSLLLLQQQQQQQQRHISKLYESKSFDILQLFMLPVTLYGYSKVRI